MEERQLPLQSVTQVIGLETVPSTQTLAEELAAAGEPEGTLVLACEQTASYGRDGRPFSAAEGGVYFTLILRPNKPVCALGSLAEKTAEAVSFTVSSVFGVKTKAAANGDVSAWVPNARKWKKMGGVLAEASAAGDVILLGVGVYVNNRLPSSAKDSSVSLKQLIGTETSKELFLDELLENFWKYYAYWLMSTH